MHTQVTTLSISSQPFSPKIETHVFLYCIYSAIAFVNIIRILNMVNYFSNRNDSMLRESPR